ncbi:MAG: hypothetical protein J6T92_03990 [Ottowia sp.]|nr:hypothetical protein [Ottowia sp.]
MSGLECLFIAVCFICAAISDAAGGTALFKGIAPLFWWVAVASFVAAVVYPVYDTWKLLTTPPPPAPLD